jgi:transposase
MLATTGQTISVVGIDIGKNSFHVVGLDDRGAIVLRQKWSRGQVQTRLANLPPCLIGMEACVGAHHLARRLEALGHDARLMPAKYVRPYSKGQKNDFRDAEAIAEAVHSAPASDPRVSPGARDRCAAGPAFPTGRTSTHPECALRHSLAADGRM